MKAYRVEAGIHVDGRTNKKYTKGQIVHSHQPLDQMFPQKFADLGEVRRVDEPPVAPERAPGSATSRPPEGETAPETKPATAPSAVETTPPASASVPAPAKKTAQIKSTSKTKSPAKAKVQGDDWK